MPLPKTLTILLIVQIIGLSPLNLEFNPETSQDSCKILFIGSSYFNFDDTPGLFQNLAETAGKDLVVDKYYPSGLYLSDHAISETTASKITEAEWDYVILQGVGSLTAYPENMTDHPVYPSLITLRDKIKANCNSTTMIFCLPWAFEDGMTWKDGWTDTYVEMQRIIYDNTLQYSHEIGFAVAPVGWAWNTVLEEKNYPTHYLHLSDWNHPSLEGSYLMACVIFSTVYHENATGISYYSNLLAENAQYFQTIASTTVLTNLSLWNPDSLITYSGLPEPDSITGIRLNMFTIFSFMGLGFILFTQKKRFSDS